MHLHVPETLSNFLWCPTLVGPYNIGHNWLGNLNSSYANIRWLNHLSSISTHFISPKSSKVVLNKFWVDYFTIWAILAHMTFCPAYIANLMFELNKGALDLVLVVLGINRPFGCNSASCGHLGWSSSCIGLDQSDRSGMTDLVKPALLWTAVNHMPYFLASMAYSIFKKLLSISWELSFFIRLDLAVFCIMPFL